MKNMKWLQWPMEHYSITLLVIGILFFLGIFGKEKSFKPAFEALPFAVFTGLSFAVPMLLVTSFIGYEFASLIGSLVSIALTVATAKKGFLVPKKTWDFGEEKDWDKEWLATSEVTEVAPSNMSLIKAWLPYLLVALILIQLSSLTSPILSAPVLYPTMCDAPFTVEPTTYEVVIIPGV